MKKKILKKKPENSKNIEKLLITQSQLIKEVEEYSNLFNYAPISYFTLDKQGKITNVNIAGANQLGYDKNELIGKHLSTFLNSKKDQDNFYTHRNRAFKTKHNERIECDFKRKNKTSFYALIESNVVKDEQKQFKHFLTTINDVSDKKEIQIDLESALAKEKELNELKSRFITIASHEFRTPLSSISLSTELLEKYYDPHDEDEEKRKKHYTRIKTSVSRLREILIDFFSLKEVELGKIINKPEIFNLVEYIHQFINEVKIYNGVHHIKYTHIGQYENIYLDKKLLNTCLTNLFINAFKYSPKGGVIEFTTEQKKPGNILFKLRDRGIGIPEKETSNIFKPFFRAKNAENIEGTGLGLEITQKMVTIMGGNISFISKENKGTTFYIEFDQNN